MDHRDVLKALGWSSLSSSSYSPHFSLSLMGGEGASVPGKEWETKWPGKERETTKWKEKKENEHCEEKKGLETEWPVKWATYLFLMDGVSYSDA